MSPRLRINRLGDIVGADSGNQDENNDDDTEDEDLDEDSQEDEDEDESDEDEDEEDDVDALKEKLATAERERERAHRRMRRADRAKSKADNELKALKEGGAKELAAAQDKVKDLEAKLAKMTGTDTQTAIREEFRDFTDVQWHNPKVAFALLDLDEIDVDDEGNVDAASLKDAIETLASKHAYLVKTSTKGKPKDKDEDEDEDEKDKRPNRPSGTRSSTSRTTREKKRTQTLTNKFGMGGRIPTP
uniref:Scaffolding protein n=1 Tax=Micrococcus phage Kurnik TaxID=3092208 RepID=A0AAU6R614_9CAUD